MKTLTILFFALVLGQALARFKKGEKCDADPHWCKHGLTCVGNPGHMRCFKLRALGEKCGRDPFWICEDGLVCKHKVCTKPKIGKKGSCNEPDDVCEDGLFCVGNHGNMKCFPKKGVGMRCKDPFWVCEDGLVCKHKVCTKLKIGKKGSCNEPDDVCEDGLDCVGNEGNKKCFPPKKVGQVCGREPFWVCAHGLLCEHKICVIGKGGSCNRKKDICAKGLSCLGKHGNKKCFAKRMLGEKCGREPFWVCEDGLVCKHKVCTKLKIGKKGSCNEPDDVCEDGLDCVGNEGNKKCFPPKKVGQVCGREPFWVCAHGLLCEHKICVIGKGGSCNRKKDICAKGLSCLGKHGNKKCFAKRKVGQKCGREPFWVCEDHLICKHKVCVKH